MSEELKPCPFCGRPARLFTNYRTGTPSGVGLHRHQVLCENQHCGQGPDRKRKVDAIAAWNRRKP